ncbi:hypothetical protein SFA35_19665 [Pseudomonas sp. HR96]|uniref:hypothetical protein n=1 Tax=Pseudomonas sp. HR96 TaxID=1027966 RepID=UPI002A74B921|nr:hypothetical protein [Pseudomonas sp. HR96]WPO98817.1 hypothetical protein SFA35_19665 [Pseudomonas sp. HR96]
MTDDTIVNQLTRWWQGNGPLYRRQDELFDVYIGSTAVAMKPFVGKFTAQAFQALVQIAGRPGAGNETAAQTFAQGFAGSMPSLR